MFSPGTRVVVRYTDNGSLTDALGEVLEVSPTHLRISTKRGPVDVPQDAIETGHEIPPAPTRPGKLHEIVSAEDLRKVAAATWSPREIAWLHADNLASELRGEDPKVLSGWLLRSAPATSAVNISALNTSAAANSALPVSDPGMPTQEALSLSIDWLKERGSTPHILIHTQAHSNELSPASQQVAPLLRGEGFVPSDPVITFTAPTAELAQLREPDGEIVESDTPAPLHYAVWGIEESAREEYNHLIASAPQYRILSAISTGPDGTRTMVGAARIAFAMKWAVLSHLVVHPDSRRTGVGSALVTAAARLAQARGVRSLMYEAPDRERSDFAHACGMGEHHRVWMAQPASE